MLLFCVITLLIAGIFVVQNLTSEKAKFNVLLITVDTLRADHLGYHGYKRNSSPFIDKLSRKSSAFYNAYAQMPKTFPSMASMMISQYPDTSGIKKNDVIVPDEALMLAEVLKRNGYYTFAYSTNTRYTSLYSSTCPGSKQDSE